MVLKGPLQIFNGFWGDHHHWMFFGRSDHCHQWFYNGFLMLLPSLSMVFDGSRPLVKWCDGFDGSSWSITEVPTPGQSRAWHFPYPSAPLQLVWDLFCSVFKWKLEAHVWGRFRQNFHFLCECAWLSSLNISVAHWQPEQQHLDPVQGPTFW